MWYNIDRKKEVVQAMVEYYVTVEWEGEGQKLEEALNRASALGGAAIYMNEQDCAAFADALNSKLTIPCHYGMFASHGGNVGKFYDIMTQQYPDNAFCIMAQGERLTI